MAEFAPVQPSGGAYLPIHVAAGRGPSAPAPVASSSNGQGAGARMDTAPTVRGLFLRTAAETAPAASAERAKIDEFTLIGPSPAFQANVLEIEQDLRRAIEKLEAERGRIEAEAAIAIDRSEADAKAADRAAKQAATPDPVAMPAPPVPMPGTASPDRATGGAAPAPASQADR